MQLLRHVFVPFIFTLLIGNACMSSRGGDIQLPATVLTVFEQQGGIASSAVVLTVQEDGTLVLEDRHDGTSYQHIAPPELLDQLQNLLANPDLASVVPVDIPHCADCFEYIITAHTTAGVQQWRFAEPAQQLSPLEEVVIVLQELRARVPTNTTPATTPIPATPGT